MFWVFLASHHFHFLVRPLRESKKRSLKKIQVSRWAEFWEWSIRASLPEFRAARYEFFLCFFFLCVCLFFNCRDWLHRKGRTARRLFQMLSNVFIIDSPFGGNIHWNQSLSDVLTHCLFTCRFIRNLLYFYKPSSQRFCTVHISDPQARTFSEVGCLLIDFLLDGEDVRYNFCSKGSGVKGLVWGSVNNPTRWHVQVKLFYFLFCFIFVFVFVFLQNFDGGAWLKSIIIFESSQPLFVHVSFCLFV